MVPRHPATYGILVLTALAGVLFLAAAPLEAARTDKELKRAQAYIQEGDFAAAKARMESYVAKEPKDPVGHFWLGRSLEEMGECDAALLSYDKALEISRALGEKGKKYIAPVLAQIGSCQSTLGDKEEALASYQAALEAGAEDRGTILVNMGSIYNSMGKIKKARETFDRVVAEDPENPTVHYNLGVVLREAAKKKGFDTNLFHQAAEAFQKAAELGKDPKYWFLAGETYMLASDEAAAKPLLEKYLSLESSGRSAAEAREYLSMIP